jgi:hypothetical protein
LIDSVNPDFEKLARWLGIHCAIVPYS